MAVKLMKLPFYPDELEPIMSRKTIDFHYGKHHKRYLMTLNELIKGTSYDHMTLEEIVEESFHGANEHEIKIYQNAAQVWNHNFFWNGMSGHASEDGLEGDLSPIIEEFGSLQKFKLEFSDAAKSLFGSGWVWLVRRPDGALAIDSFLNADNPVARGNDQPLLTLDVWEHAYYLDYQNDRAKFIGEFWKIVNWDFVAANLARPPVESLFRPQEDFVAYAH